MTSPVPTPECEKLAAVREQSQAIGEFLEWLASKAMHIAEHQVLIENRFGVEEQPDKAWLGRWAVRDLFSLALDDVVARYDTREQAEVERDRREAARETRIRNDPDTVPTLVISRRNTEELLAEFFGIDLAKVEAERRALLASLGG